MDHKHAELFDLASKFHDDCLDRDELARLNGLLQNEEARREFVDFAQIHYCLKAAELSEDCRKLASSIGAVHRSIVPDVAPMSRQPRPEPLEPMEQKQQLPSGFTSRASRRILFASLAVCASLLVLVTAILLSSSVQPLSEPQASVSDKPPSNDRPLATADPPSSAKNVSQNRLPVGGQAHFAPKTPQNEPVPGGHPADYVARIVAVTNRVAWAPEGGPSDFLMRLSAGERINVTAGLVKFEFVDGAVIILRAPAELQLLTSRSARLFAGSLTGRSEAGQFTLQTPKAEVIDVGTEFGVSVDRLSDTNVAVFDGEVHVKSSSGERARLSLVRLTTGMSMRIDHQGMMESGPGVEQLDFQRVLPAENLSNLGIGEVSLIDVICGSGIGEYRIAGAIDPLSGHWGERPWKQPKGVELRSGEGRYVHVDWNPLVDGVFVPRTEKGWCHADSQGNAIKLPGCTGATWGPVWARRRTNGDLDAMSHPLDLDDEGFWGAGTITAMLDRLRWARDGLVGLHSNVGVTIDLDAVRDARSAAVSRLRGVVTLLERSHVSQPFQPKSLADFRVYVDGQQRYQRLAFSREEGDAQFGATIEDSDRYLTLIVTDSGDGHTFDRVILIDPVLELSLD